MSLPTFSSEWSGGDENRPPLPIPAALTVRVMSWVGDKRAMVGWGEDPEAEEEAEVCVEVGDRFRGGFTEEEKEADDDPCLENRAKQSLFEDGEREGSIREEVPSRLVLSEPLLQVPMALILASLFFIISKYRKGSEPYSSIFRPPFRFHFFGILTSSEVTMTA